MGNFNLQRDQIAGKEKEKMSGKALNCIGNGVGTIRNRLKINLIRGGRPQRQARYDDRNLGTQKSYGALGAEGEARNNAGGFEQHRVDTKYPFELVGISRGVLSI